MMCTSEEYTSEEIREIILHWQRETGQHEVLFAVAYCVGFFNAVDSKIFKEIKTLIREGVLKP